MGNDTQLNPSEGGDENDKKCETGRKRTLRPNSKPSLGTPPELFIGERANWLEPTDYVSSTLKVVCYKKEEGEQAG
ncbi:hypothetical protein A1QU_05780 [Vibrio anguillarum]|nr:hypothetical protein A1QU_05780 [Vibrio anguillarum]